MGIFHISDANLPVGAQSNQQGIPLARHCLMGTFQRYYLYKKPTTKTRPYYVFQVVRHETNFV